MKILHQDLVSNGAGSVKMMPDESDDLWFVYNLIATGDRVMAWTVRKVISETCGGMGRVVERIPLELEIKAEAIDYDKAGSVLRIKGKNTTVTKYVKIGAYHTLVLELHRPFVLRKATWDSMALDLLQQSSDSAASADLAVVLMQEGLANILLVGKSMTTTRSVIETSIPRKHGPAVASYELALKKFLEKVLQSFLRYVDFNVVRCAVIAGPGFTKDQFYHHLLLEADRRQLRAIIANKSRIVLVNTSSGYKEVCFLLQFLLCSLHSLKEVLYAPQVMSLINDAKAVQEVRVLKEFFDMLSKDSARACYGPKHVEFAHEQMAVDTLLLTDDLFRNANVTERKKYVNLVKSVKKLGGTAHIFSSMHVSGEQLAQMTGVAAILRFPLPDLDDLEI